MKLYFFLLLTAALSSPVYAQTVIQASSALLQTRINRDAEGFSDCGIRAVVIDLKPQTAEAYDFTINLRLGLQVGMVKAGKAVSTRANLLKGKQNTNAIKPGPLDFWIAPESEGKAMRPLKVIPADTDGYILQGVELTMAWHTILAIVDGERMQFALRYKNQDIETVMSFSSKLKDEDRKPLMACLSGLVERMKAGINEKGDAK